MSLLATLTSIGLSEKEARVYLAALEVGVSGVAEISKRARINRVTTYDILEKLMQKGMMSSSTKKGTQVFDATDPSIIANDVKQRALDFKNILPDLKRLRGDAIHPRVRYFEGIEGIKAVYEDTLTAKTEILNFANSREIRLHWPNYDKEYVEKRVKKKIYLRGISPLDDHGKMVQSKDKDCFREIRLVPAAEFTFTNEINIYDDKVAIISYKDVPLWGMIIESAEISNTQRDIFKMAWEFAEGKFVTPATPK